MIDMTELGELESKIIWELMACEIGCSTVALAFFVCDGDDVDSVTKTLNACASLEEKGHVKGEGLPIMWSLVN